MLILYCIENGSLFLLYLMIFLPNYYKKKYIFSLVISWVARTLAT